MSEIESSGYRGEKSMSAHMARVFLEEIKVVDKGLTAAGGGLS